MAPKIVVYNKAYVRKTMIGDPVSATIIPRHNAVGAATVVVRANHRAVPHLLQPGARMVITDDETNVFLLSGRVVKRSGSGGLDSTMTFEIEDDFAILGHVLGWVLPANTIDNQGAAGSNWEMTGPAESVLKAAVSQNAVTRLGGMGVNLSVAADLARGATISASLRFHPLFDRLFPVVDGSGLEAAGIGVTVRQQNAGLVLDVYVPKVYPRPLTEAGGAIAEWSWSNSEPTATRVVVGGQGAAQLRVFRHIEDTTREADIGRIIERWRDDSGESDVTRLYLAGQETIDDGAAKSGLSLTLSQTANFRYGKSLSVGDQATIELASGVQITDVLKEATLSWSGEDGWKATPKIGERTDDPDLTFGRVLSRIVRAISNQTRT